MKTALIVIAAIVSVWILVGVATAAWQTFSQSGRKRRRALSAMLLSQIPKGAFGVLLLVFMAFRGRDREKANQIVADHDAKADALLAVLRRPRDPSLSSGSVGDRLSLDNWTAELREQGYSQRAGEIVALAFQHNLDGLLDELIERRAWESEKVSNITTETAI